MKDKILYLECYSGISGDMTVAALIDLGADQSVLRKGLESLNVEGYVLEIGRKEKNSIDACDFNVILEHAEDHEHVQHHESEDMHDHIHYHETQNTHEISPEYKQAHEHEYKQEHEQYNDHNHPHDHEHDHTHSHGDHDHEHSHLHSFGHNHDHSHSHSHEEDSTPIKLGHHDHRNLATINEIIEHSSITDQAKLIAKRIFYIVASAEAKAHGKPIEEVHFHEVGAVDSIVDIVATAICLDNLNIKEVVISELHEGTGFINCQHGLLPIPVPAVINIATEHQLPLHITTVKGELVTPTGAAIAAAIRTRDTLPAEMKILKVGLGAGKRNYAGASGLLRALLIEETSSQSFHKPANLGSSTNSPNEKSLIFHSSLPSNTSTDNVWVLEANIDDCSGEALGYAMELLLKSGAKDVYYAPIFMKKNRPAYLLGVLCSYDTIEILEEIIFTHTTTIGIRKSQAERTVLNRAMKTVASPYGNALVKVCNFHGKTFFYPEYESVKKLCEISGKDYMTLYREIQNLSQADNL